MESLKMITEWIRKDPVPVVLALLLSAAAGICYLIPYVQIYRIVGILVYTETWTADAARGIVRHGLFAAAGCAGYVIAYFGALSLSHVGAFGIGYRMRMDLAEYLSRIPLGMYHRMGTGTVLSNLYGNVNQIQSYLAHDLIEIVIAVVLPLALLAGMIAVNPWYTAALAVGIAVAGYYNYMSYSYAEGGGKKMMDIYLTALERLKNAAEEFVRGKRVFQVFGHRNSVCSDLDAQIVAYSDSCAPYTLVWEKFDCVFSTILSNLYLVLFPCAALLLWIHGWSKELTVDTITFLLLTPTLKTFVPKAAAVGNHSVRSAMAEGRIREMEMVPARDPGQGVPFPQKIGKVEMCQVCFSYRKGGETVRNVNITAEEGTLTAIVGPSGGGKSTVAGLLAGFWDPDDGRILIGGVDAGTIAPAERMKNISMVFQDCFLYRDTIRENIRSARPDATEEEVVRAAKAACCHDFITALPKGYDTVIGEEGRRFSGGEQRRIALARAFLKDAPILILDEATSSVDAENEYYLQKAVEALAREKTVIMISHRLSNVTAARRIYYMEDGLVWESGSHDELLKQNGRYASLWDIGRKNVQWTIGNGEVAE